MFAVKCASPSSSSEQKLTASKSSSPVLSKVKKLATEKSEKTKLSPLPELREIVSPQMEKTIQYGGKITPYRPATDYPFPGS